MKYYIIVFFFSFCVSIAKAQKVGVGTSTPAAKMDIRGSGSTPAIPGLTSTGVLRIGINPNDAIDIGKMTTTPFSGWIQAGYDGTTTDPLSLQPLGGNVGIGTSDPITKMTIRGLPASPAIPGAASSGIVRIATTSTDGIDIGKSATTPFEGWIQSGNNGTAQPLSLQPIGGNLGVGTSNPKAKMAVMGSGGMPSYPGSTSTGIVRIGLNTENSALDIGKMATFPYSSWIQSGRDGNLADPLSLQPMGGRVGIGVSSPAAKVDIFDIGAAPMIPGTNSSGAIRIGTSTTSSMDLGKMGTVPFAGWIQAGYNGTTPDPITIQPLGGNVGIGVTAPVSSAALDVTSTTKGFLPPRMTFAQRNAIQNPVAGLVIWCTDCDELQVYNGTIWKNLLGEAATELSPPHVTICGQDWMVRNLDVSTYQNGDPIPHITSLAAWYSTTSGAYCYYQNDSATYAAVYGKLYNWYAVNDPRGLGPPGWHVPSLAEWETLANCLGGYTVAGGEMKETGTLHWYSPNEGATNSSGFTALAAGKRDEDGTYNSANSLAIYWTSTINGLFHGFSRSINYWSTQLDSPSYIQRMGFSVRCVKD